MPEKPLTIATYAAGASLAAITLVYVFAPTYFIDSEAAGSSASNRKRGVVGLANSANDCFINSVLQAFAGLGDLRIYLIREVHRRHLDGASVYKDLVQDPDHPDYHAWKIDGLQRGVATRGLKEMLDSLNERPLYKKTITASPFVRCLEDAFRQRLSRNQQDAQEFLQVVAERLCDEYHAGRRARKRARDFISQAIENPSRVFDENDLDRQLSRLAVIEGDENSPTMADSIPDQKPLPIVTINESRESESADDEEGFPMEGKSESQIECLTCGFKPKPSQSTFCTLTLNVPQVSSTTLNACFDGMLKTEYIEDFKCERCRLVHALETLEQEMRRSTSEQFKTKTQKSIDSLKIMIETDPEEIPKDLQLPDSKFAPKRKIARHVRITQFPKILAIHLSRSIFDIGKSSMKNSAKVQFPERLPLGGLLSQKKYKLLAVVTHKGSHHSGHYESFRRQNLHPPFSNPNTVEKTGAFSKVGTPTISISSTPQINAVKHHGDISTPSTPEMLSPNSPSTSSRISLVPSLPSPQDSPTDVSSPSPNGRPMPQATPHSPLGPTSAPRDSDSSSLRSLTRTARSTLSKVPTTISNTLSRSGSVRSLSSPKMTETTGTTPSVALGKPVSAAQPHHRKKTTDRWWRISDDQIKESKTRQVLGMQKEAYLLFYELERGEDDS